MASPPIEYIQRYGAVIPWNHPGTDPREPVSKPRRTVPFRFRAAPFPRRAVPAPSRFRAARVSKRLLKIAIHELIQAPESPVHHGLREAHESLEPALTRNDRRSDRSEQARICAVCRPTLLASVRSRATPQAGPWHCTSFQSLALRKRDCPYRSVPRFRPDSRRCRAPDMAATRQRTFQG